MKDIKQFFRDFFNFSHATRVKTILIALFFFLAAIGSYNLLPTPINMILILIIIIVGFGGSIAFWMKKTSTKNK